MFAPWDIELPIDWFEKLEQTGEVPLLADDDRRSQRWMTQSHALMWFEESHLPRGTHPLGIYTRDFSSCGASFLAPLKIFHDEQVRIALPTFWMSLNVVRTERITSKCYEIGARVISRHDPSWEAFVQVGRLTMRVASELDRH